MLGLGFWELVILGLIALIVIGPERLPDFAKGVAKFLNEMRRTASDLKRTFDDEKDIFKENIDQLQKLKNDIQSFPELDSEPNKKKESNLLDHYHDAHLAEDSYEDLKVSPELSPDKNSDKEPEELISPNASDPNKVKH